MVGGCFSAHLGTYFRFHELSFFYDAAGLTLYTQKCQKLVTDFWLYHKLLHLAKQPRDEWKDTSHGVKSSTEKKSKIKFPSLFQKKSRLYLYRVGAYS